jgi:hypothetical protein
MDAINVPKIAKVTIAPKFEKKGFYKINNVGMLEEIINTKNVFISTTAKHQKS